MTSETQSVDNEWVSVSIFYVRRPRTDQDPANVLFHAEVLYGEGLMVPEPNPALPSPRSENLGNGLRVLRVANRMSVVAKTLTMGHYDHRIDRNRVERFAFDLVRRPLVVGVAERNGVVSSPMNAGYRLHQFVRVEKVALLQRITAMHDGPHLARAFAEKLLDALAEIAGRDFRGSDVRWLGDIVIAERFQPRVAWWTGVHSTDGKSCRGLDVHVDPRAPARVHVQIRAAGLDEMCICDRLLEWSPGESVVRRIGFDEELGSVFIRAWLDSNLVLEEQYAVLRGFAGTVGMVGASYTIQDRLTQKLAAAIRGGQASSGTLNAAQAGQTTGLTTRMSTNSMDSEPWAGANLTRDRILDLVTPRAPDYAHFPARAEGRAKAILHFAAVVSQSDQAYLVDPYFDVVGAEALLPRVSGDVKLTILTNLPLLDHAEKSKAVTEFLRAASVIGLPENLGVICLEDASTEHQLFHDRFLLVRRGGSWAGYILTNSFSGLATQYPLFVAEVPIGTTALLLGELERIMNPGFATTKVLWPAPASSEPTHRPERGTFPYWRLFLLALVPRNKSREGPWLRLAEKRGFVICTEDGLKWIMKPRERDAALSLLLRGSLPSRLRKLSKREWRTSRKPDTNTGTLRLSLGRGTAIMILGDLVARGFEANARSIAERAGERLVPDLERILRESFTDDPDPTILRPGASRDRLGLRQSLSPSARRVETMRYALALWNSRFIQSGRGTRWDRCFAYAVLAYLAPERAVHLCETMLDADFLLALVDSLRRKIVDWDQPLAIALSRSKAPVLKALGIESLAHSSFGPFGRSLASPDEVRAAVVRGREGGVSDDDAVCHVVMWGVNGGRESSSAADQVVGMLANASQATIDDAVGILLDGMMRTEPFLGTLVDKLLEESAEPSSALLDAIVKRFAQRFAPPLAPALSFSTNVDLELTVIMARAIAALALRRNRSIADEIRNNVPLKEIQDAIVPLTPFRKRERAEVSDVAHGWITLWELLAASSTGEQAAVTAPTGVVAGALAYLATRDLGGSGKIRAVLKDVLGPAGEATVQGPQADEPHADLEDG